MMFDANQIGMPNGNYFALPFSVEDAALALVAAPWDVTTSYSAGTAGAPVALLDASAQIDLYDLVYGDFWQQGIGTVPLANKWLQQSAAMRKQAQKVIAMLEKEVDKNHPRLRSLLQKVNDASAQFNDYVYNTTRALLQQNKRVGLVGGDHSTPFGYLRALAEQHTQWGILHIDAHADLRQAYEGFEYSHASIIYNVLKHLPQVAKIVQVGIRDLCNDEVTLAQNDARVVQFNSYAIAQNEFCGGNWATLCKKIVDELPQKVYVSFDIDGLSPDNCLHTGTPVPGGLSFLQACYLLQQLSEAGKTVIGFDLCEVCPHPHSNIDVIVGARMLYKLCGCLLSSK
ncbi:agmatinase [Bacteroidia bacterium]|nr:agmatinase [Bacteroidia bacterium]